MYQALARKYRPQRWLDVVGQDHVTRTLGNALTAGRLHHAYLFCGARGVGKTTVARILAKAVNCAQRGEQAEPCNQCPSCLDITESRSLDVQEIDGASNTSVDDVREIRERIKYLPTGERYKIYIIDEVHMLSKAAFNALLKTLEEPPPHVIFVFATTEPHKIPVTILSRCQRYDFRRVSVAQIVETLRRIAADEGVIVSEDVLCQLAGEADGGLRDAESLLDQAVAFCGKTITLEQVRQLLGLTDHAFILRLVESITQRNASAVLTGLEEIFQAGGNLPRLAQELLEVFRHLWILKSCGSLSNPAELPSTEVEALQRLGNAISLEEAQQWFAILFRGLDDIVRGRLPKLAMEMVLLHMVQVGPVEPIGSLIERVEAMAGRGGNAEPSRTAAPAAWPAAHVAVPQAAAAPAPAAGARSAPLATVSMPTSTPAPVAWSTLVTQLRGERPQLASILEHGTVRRVDPAHFEVEFPKASLYAEMLKEVDRSAQLQQFLHKHLGFRGTIAVLQGEGPTPAEQKAAERTVKSAKQQQHQEQAVTHELVRQAGKLFGAEIKEVKILKE